MSKEEKTPKFLFKHNGLVYAALIFLLMIVDAVLKSSGIEVIQTIAIVIVVVMIVGAISTIRVKALSFDWKIVGISIAILVLAAIYIGFLLIVGKGIDFLLVQNPVVWPMVSFAILTFLSMVADHFFVSGRTEEASMPFWLGIFVALYAVVSQSMFFWAIGGLTSTFLILIVIFIDWRWGSKKKGRFVFESLLTWNMRLLIATAVLAAAMLFMPFILSKVFGGDLFNTFSLLGSYLCAIWYTHGVWKSFVRYKNQNL